MNNTYNTWKYLSSAPETSTMYILTTKVVVATFPIDWQTAHRRKNANSNQYLRICEIMMENWPAIAITSTPKRTGFRPTLEPKKLAALQPSTAARNTLVCFRNKKKTKTNFQLHHPLRGWMLLLHSSSGIRPLEGMASGSFR